MKTHLVINGVDYTPHIVDDSYDINSNDVYESWEDGNKVEHRIPVTKKISGAVQILCSEKSGWLHVEDFLADLNAATDNSVLTCGVFVPNLNAFKALDCYYTLKNTSHIKDGSNLFSDIFELELKER